MLTKDKAAISPFLEESTVPRCQSLARESPATNTPIAPKWIAQANPAFTLYSITSSIFAMVGSVSDMLTMALLIIAIDLSYSTCC